jgi:hypothetical protein
MEIELADHFDRMNMVVEELLKGSTPTQIATTTGGMYFRAEDKEGLIKIYKQIESMEKRKITHKVIQADPPPTPQAFLNWSFAILLMYLAVASLIYLPQINE